MFVLSKIGWLLIEPGNVVLVWLAVAFVLLRRGRTRVAQHMVAAAVVLLLLFAVTPAGSWMLTALEDRFPVVTKLPDHVDGVIVLGGALDPFLTRERGQPELHEGAERITAMVALARHYPEAPIVFTGGNGHLDGTRPSEAVELRPLLAQLHVPEGRIRFEEKSRNTHENAVFSSELVRPPPGTRWLLVTSAVHMPRAVGTFRQAGWNVIAFPVDHLTPGGFRLRPPLMVMMGLLQATVAFKEMTGLVAYRVLGRSDALFPSPADSVGDHAGAP